MERPCLTFGVFRLNCANGTLLRDGDPLPVGQRAVRILEALLQRPGEVLTKGELMDAAWPEVTVEESNLHVQIASLRKNLGPAPGGDDWIVTIPRVGYRFVPETVSNDGTATAGVEVAHSGWAWLPPRSPERHRYGAKWIAAAIVALALASVFGFVTLRAVLSPPASVAPSDPVVVVLPFDDMSGSPDLAYFGEGVSRDIAAMLTRVPNLSVVARSSSSGYFEQAVDVRDIGRELGATHVLEGSFRKDPDRLRIVAQLIDARTGQHIWAERFDRTGTDPWMLQDEVTERIVAALGGTAGTLALQQYREAWGKDTTNLQEYDYVLRTLSRIAVGTPESAAASEAVLAEGLIRFPDSPLLKAQAASTVVWRFARGWSDSENPLEEMRRAGVLAREALNDPAASPMLRSLAHISLAYANLAERRYEQAVAEAEAVIALSPYDGRMVYYLAEIPILAGRPELALEWIERATTFYHADDPRQHELASVKALAQLRTSGPTAALETLNSIRSSDAIVLRSTYLLRALALVFLDRLDDAKIEVGKLREHDPTWTLAKHRRRFFYASPENLEATIAALALAGLPEN